MPIVFQCPRYTIRFWKRQPDSSHWGTMPTLSPSRSYPLTGYFFRNVAPIYEWFDPQNHWQKQILFADSRQERGFSRYALKIFLGTVLPYGDSTAGFPFRNLLTEDNVLLISRSIPNPQGFVIAAACNFSSVC